MRSIQANLHLRTQCTRWKARAAAARRPAWPPGPPLIVPPSPPHATHTHAGHRHAPLPPHSTCFHVPFAKPQAAGVQSAATMRGATADAQAHQHDTAPGSPFKLPSWGMPAPTTRTYYTKHAFHSVLWWGGALHPAGRTCCTLGGWPTHSLRCQASNCSHTGLGPPHWPPHLPVLLRHSPTLQLPLQGEKGEGRQAGPAQVPGVRQLLTQQPGGLGMDAKPPAS